MRSRSRSLSIGGLALATLAASLAFTRTRRIRTGADLPNGSREARGLDSPSQAVPIDRPAGAVPSSLTASEIRAQTGLGINRPTTSRRCTFRREHCLANARNSSPTGRVTRVFPSYHRRAIWRTRQHHADPGLLDRADRSGECAAARRGARPGHRHCAAADQPGRGGPGEGPRALAAVAICGPDVVSSRRPDPDDHGASPDD